MSAYANWLTADEAIKLRLETRLAHLYITPGQWTVESSKANYTRLSTCGFDACAAGVAALCGSLAPSAWWYVFCTVCECRLRELCSVYSVRELCLVYCSCVGSACTVLVSCQCSVSVFCVCGWRSCFVSVVLCICFVFRAVGLV